jgi:signal transduction histidine kinase
LTRETADLFSLTRAVYLASLFYVPLKEREWQSLWLAPTDQFFFRRLKSAGIVESSNGGFLLSTDRAKQLVVRKFLYDSYQSARESVRIQTAQRVKENRQRRVRSRELDRQALDMAPDGIVCVDPYGYLYYMNPAAESMLNNTLLREALFGKTSLEESLRAYSRDNALDKIKSRAPEDGRSIEVFGNRIIITGPGRRFEVELGSQVILLRDTTDHYLIDNEIGSLYRHELKAELDVIAVGLNMTRQLVEQGLSDEALPCLDQLEQKRAELCSMLEERIDFIRLHSDAFQIRGTLVNLNLVVDKCVANYREAAAEKDLSLSSNHLDGPQVTVQGEERFLSRALDNIIRNAVKFCQRGGEIGILLEASDGEAYVSVEDTGPGIAPENLGKIFELGFTTGGSGRGLYMAKRIVLAHRGCIDVRSEHGRGACFTLRLPAAVEEV